MVIKIVRDQQGYQHLRHGDTALLVGHAAQLPTPTGVCVFRDKADLTVAMEGAISTEELVALLFVAEKVFHE